MMIMEGKEQLANYKRSRAFINASSSPFYSTSLAIAGKDFCVIASDTRQSTGYSINSRYSPKAYKLSETSVIAMNGFHADGLTLKKVLDQRLKVKKKDRQRNEKAELNTKLYIVSGINSVMKRTCLLLL